MTGGGGAARDGCEGARDGCAGAGAGDAKGARDRGKARAHGHGHGHGQHSRGHGHGRVAYVWHNGQQRVSPSAALAGTDLLGLHRDLSGYYRQFGFLDASTTQALAERVIYPHCVGPPAAPPRERPADSGRQRQAQAGT